MTKWLIILVALLVAGVAGGDEPSCVLDESLFMVDAAGKETCFNFVQAEKRIKALEEKVERLITDIRVVFPPCTDPLDERPRIMCRNDPVEVYGEPIR